MTADRLRAAAQAGDGEKEEARHEGGPKAKGFQGLSYVVADTAASPKSPSRRKRPKGATLHRIASVGLSQIYGHTRYSLAHGLDVDPDAVVFAVAMMLGSG